MKCHGSYLFVGIKRQLGSFQKGRALLIGIGI